MLSPLNGESFLRTSPQRVNDSEKNRLKGSLDFQNRHHERLAGLEAEYKRELFTTGH
jgi:hypothetical protein